jgi:hypothetical protein
MKGKRENTSLNLSIFVSVFTLIERMSSDADTCLIQPPKLMDCFAKFYYVKTHTVRRLKKLGRM